MNANRYSAGKYEYRRSIVDRSSGSARARGDAREQNTDSGNTSEFRSRMMRGLIALALTWIVSGPAQARVPDETAVRDQQVETMMPGDGILPADRDFGLTWAASVDAESPAAPLLFRLHPGRVRLAAVAPAHYVDVAIAMRATAPVYLALYSPPRAPDPMPKPERVTVPPSVLTAMALAMMLLVFTVSLWNRPNQPETEQS